MKLLFLGDIVGQQTLDLIRRDLPAIVAKQNIDVVVANAENAAGGSGLTPKQFRQLRHSGVDLITMGDHVFKKVDILSTLKSEDRICRPANFPANSPGREFVIAESKCGVKVAAFSVLGRVFMRPVDCPFVAADRVLSSIGDQAKIIIADIHAEATADKYLLGHYLKGRVTAVLGTHTHVPTADAMIFPEGTAFQCDVGMCGPHDGVLGRRVDRVMSAALDFVPLPFDVSGGDLRLSGAILTVDPDSGKALAIDPFLHRFDVEG